MPCIFQRLPLERLADLSDSKVLSVTDNSGVIEFRNKNTVAFTVPARSITEILHSTQEIRRSTKAYNYFESMCCGDTQSELLPMLAAAISAPLGHSKVHYVEIRWYFNGDHAVALALWKSDYLPFMNWLNQVSGTKWVDIEQEREQALKTIEASAGAAFPVWLSHPAGVASRYSTETYLVLPIESQDRTELFFFREKVKPKNIVGILPAVRQWSDNKCRFRRASVIR